MSLLPNSCPIHDRDRTLLEQGLHAIGPRVTALRAVFFRKMFERHPEIEGLFGAYSISQQQQMVHQMLEAILDLNDAGSWLNNHLAALGRQHSDNGVQTHMYAALVPCFVEAVEEVFGLDWSPEHARVWTGAIEEVCAMMRTGCLTDESASSSTDRERFAGTDLLSLEVHTFEPEPFYRWLRDEEPLYWDPNNHLWAVSRYADVVYISRRTDLFCSGNGVVPGVTTDVWPDEAMINLDGKPHTCQRGLVAKGFSPRRIEALEPVIREAATAIVDRLGPRGEADLVQDLARPLPFRIIAGMLGYPEQDIQRVLDWTDVYTRGGCGAEYITDEVAAAFAEFSQFHFRLLEEKRNGPGGDLLTIWLNAEIDGMRLSEDKLLFEHNLLLVGGSETTRSAISLGLLALMQHPEQWAYLLEHVDDRDVLGAAVEEMVRWACPFVRMARTATQDVQMHGRTIERGQQVLLLYPSANHDPRVFEHPERFDVRRDPDKPALSFGIGKHYCLGASLARLETRIVLETVLRRLPDIRQKPGTEPVRHRSCFVRSLTHLPVMYTPTS